MDYSILIATFFILFINLSSVIVAPYLTFYNASENDFIYNYTSPLKENYIAATLDVRANPDQINSPTGILLLILFFIVACCLVGIGAICVYYHQSILNFCCKRNSNNEFQNLDNRLFQTPDLHSTTMDMMYNRHYVCFYVNKM